MLSIDDIPEENTENILAHLEDHLLRIDGQMKKSNEPLLINMSQK